MVHHLSSQFRMREAIRKTTMKKQSFIPHHDEEDSLSSVSSMSLTPTPALALMPSPPASPLAATRKAPTQAAAVAAPPPLQSSRPDKVTLPSSTRTSRSISRASNPHTPASAVRIAIDMRTRSSRLFFVLLHLVGVSTNVPSGRSSSSSYSGGGSASDIFSFVRQHRPSWLTWSTGIVGVHPTAILLERLHVESSRRGLKGILDRVERVWGWDGNSDLLGEPYWFQDNFDGQCLDPSGGFSDCGDATLWRLRRRPLTKRQLREKRYRQRNQDKKEKRRIQLNNQRLQQQQHRIYHEEPTSSSVCVWPFFCEQNSQVSQPTHIEYDEVYGFEYENYDEEEEGFALQLMDIDAMTANSSFLSHRMAGLREGNRRRQRRRFFWTFNDDGEQEETDDECLISFPSAKNGGSALQVGSCSSEDAWVWHVNRDGILVRGSTKAEKRKRKRRWRVNRRASAAASDGSEAFQSAQADFTCIHRNNSTLATLLPCDGDSKQQADDLSSLVGFSLVRYPTTLPMKSSKKYQHVDAMWEPWTTLEVSMAESSPDNSSEVPANKSTSSLPESRTSSQNHASTGAKHRKVDVKSTASMLHTGIEQGKAKKDAATSASHIRDSPVAMNGVAFHNQRMNKLGDANEGRLKRPSSTKLRLEKKSKDSRSQTPIHSEPSEGGDQPGPDSNPHKPRKIPVHPYIQSSKDFVWVDPLTSLEYPTDLCRYLGHTKKEVGRHTLMGVGQYYRTAFNIKVYGAAFYVAKRDVLADPKFGEYATLTSDELRGRADFYEHLMNMPSPEEDPATALGGLFDRTLFIKINMQLSTDAMRKSLEADWSLLTDEMKTLIIDSSFEERMADERMQRKIQSKENSSNCSCGQSAPPELNADPTCCARGTELVFTWRKNGDFEIRLDGRAMDAFPRPDIARGIFSEYLNDNPISLDAKAHFADGFPFLLAPLAQVKGMSSAVPQTHEPPKKVGNPSSDNPMHRLMNAAIYSVGTMNTQAHSLSKWMQDSAAGMSSTAMGSAMGVARGLSEELDKQRMELVDNAVALQREGMDMLTSLMKMSADDQSGLALTIVNQAMPSFSPFSAGFETYNRDAGVKPPEILPDEIGIKIEPTYNFSHRLFFATVHIYLFLMLIVSIPGSNTRLVVRRRILETKKLVESKSQGAFAAMSKLH